MLAHARHWPIIAALAHLGGGCETASLPTLPATLGIPVTSVSLAEPPVEVYSRIAKHALHCWFGLQGSLKRTHIFHADVAPPEAGGGAEITISERDPAAQTPRNFRAYRIQIAAAGGGSSLTTENYRMPQPTAEAMGADIGRWVQGKEGCSVVGVGGWGAQNAKEEPLPAPPKKSLKTKAKAP